MPRNTNNESSTPTPSTKYQLAYPIVNAVKYASVLDKVSLRTSSVNSLAVSQNKIISGGIDETIKVWQKIKFNNIQIMEKRSHMTCRHEVLPPKSRGHASAFAVCLLDY